MKSGCKQTQIGAIPESWKIGGLGTGNFHQKRMRTTNMVERVNQERKRRTRRTRRIRIFPNVDSLMRVIIARLSELSAHWKTGKVYLPMNPKSQLLAT